MTSDAHSIQVNGLEEGEMIIGYIGMFKVLSREGKYYWATRSYDVNDMEALGMAHDMVSSFGSDINGGKESS